MKRLTWFASGVLTGAAGLGYARRKVRATAAQLAPSHIATTVVARARDRVGDLVDALREGRMAMRAKEVELRAVRDGRLQPLAPELAPGDQLLIDGQPVEPGRVIVLRQVAPERAARRWRAR